MCTAITYQGRDHYFGRTLDYARSYGEEVVIAPRNFPFSFRKMPELPQHYALLGMAAVEETVPLFYDAVNETGLAMAGLLFAGNAVYFPVEAGKDNISPFELIPWILGQCADLRDVRRLLARLNLADIPFSEKLPLSPLHWLIADRESALTLESSAEGLRIHENPAGVLTNNPPFDYQMTRLADFLQLSPDPPPEHMGGLSLRPYSRGMGAIGLPGDLSSSSRFVRAAFTKLHARPGTTEKESVGQFFHILGAVEQQRGCNRGADGDAYTLYTSCCNQEQGIYYYTTYDNRQISAVDLRRADLESSALLRYPPIPGQQICFRN